MISPSWQRLDQESLDKRTDKLFEIVGGFGRYQILMNLIYVLYNKSVHLILLSLSFLEKVPKEYFCAYEDAPN